MLTLQNRMEAKGKTSVAMPLSQQIQHKIDLLCYGVRPNGIAEKIYAKQNPFDQKRTGNIGIQMLIGKDRLPANIPVFHHFTQSSPYEIIESEDSYFAKRVDGAGVILPLLDVAAPEWYVKPISGGKHAGDYLLQEGMSTLIASITGSCFYADKGIACTFCAIGKGSSEMMDDGIRKDHILKSIDCAFEHGTEQYTSINFTGGNSASEDRGIMNYFAFVEHIRAKSDLPICLEVSPPKNLDIIDECVSKGVNAFMMNLEVWDESLRKLFMPAKSRIKRDEYLKGMERAVKLLGKGNVSSVLIIGLEREESVMSAITELVRIGVVPSIMPLRPNNGTVLENFSLPSPGIVKKLTTTVAQMLNKNGFSMDKLPGCIGCGACAAERDEFGRICGITGEN